MGIRTFKFFLTYLKQGWYTDDYQLIRAMDVLTERGGMAMVHAENGGGIDYLEDKYLKGPSASPASFNATCPAALEEEVVFHQGWNWDANGPAGFASAARATRIGIGAYPIFTSNEEELGPVIATGMAAAVSALEREAIEVCKEKALEIGHNHGSGAALARIESEATAERTHEIVR